MNAQVKPKQEHDAEPNFQLPIKDYHQFYRFYLTEHRNISESSATCRGQFELDCTFSLKPYLNASRVILYTA